MTLNRYFNQKYTPTQNLYEDLIIEAIQIYGQNAFYIPRELVDYDRIYGDDNSSRFDDAYSIEVYPENIEGFDGEGDLFTKFGIEIRDQATFVVARSRWRAEVTDQSLTRPQEGDLIYLPLSHSMFQIMHVEHESPFYQFSNLPTWKLRCELFEYNDDQFDTGIDSVDDIEQTGFVLKATFDSSDFFTLDKGRSLVQVLSDGVTVSAEIVELDSDNLIASLAHVSTSDGEYHPFTANHARTLDSNGDSYSVTATTISEQFANSLQQNSTFTDAGNDLIDFSEDNPFGEPTGS